MEFVRTMPQFAYDLHIHSCLSPCGDEAMTPPNIANMAYIKGLELIAVTDHNSARNVRAVMRAAEGLPLTVIPGIEVTTAEEIHVVCLFPDAECAEQAGAYFETLLPPVKNKAEYFGEQLVMDENETVKEHFPYLLSNALNLSIDALPALVRGFGGFCYPAHIDRPANSVLAIFGCLPDEPRFGAVEVQDPARFFAKAENRYFQTDYIVVTSSDAHTLGHISEREHFLALDRPDFESLRRVLEERA
jgi:PHP family Zn ribbon phosphoesterase